VQDLSTARYDGVFSSFTILHCSQVSGYQGFKDVMLHRSISRRASAPEQSALAMFSLVRSKYELISALFLLQTRVCYVSSFKAMMFSHRKDFDGRTYVRFPIPLKEACSQHPRCTICLVYHYHHTSQMPPNDYQFQRSSLQDLHSSYNPLPVFLLGLLLVVAQSFFPVGGRISMN